MNEQEQQEQPRVTSVEQRAEQVVAEIARDPVALFTDEPKFREFLDRIKTVVGEFEVDISTKKGREAIASLSYKITRSKSALDKTGLSLTEEWRRQTNLVNSARKMMVTELDALAKDVRRPLTEWEEEERRRTAMIDENIAMLESARHPGPQETSGDIEARGRRLHELVLPPEIYGDRLAEAEEVRAESVQLLAQAMHTKRDQEARDAELEQLRREKAEREARDEHERRGREAEGQRERDEEAARALAEAKRREAEEAERQRREREERIAREAREQAEREAREKEERERAEAERRRQDAEHRRDVRIELHKAITDICGNRIAFEAATELANAMIDGEIPRVTVQL